MTKLEAKTRNLIVNLAHKIEDSVTPKSRRSEIIEVSFMKIMNDTALKDFRNAFNNKLKYGATSVVTYDIKFTPEHKCLEFKISHQMTAYSFYSKKKDKTYMFVADHGYIDFTNVFGNAHLTGSTVVLDGNVDFEEFAETSEYINLLTRLYYEKDAEMEKFREEHKDEESVA